MALSQPDLLTLLNADREKAEARLRQLTATIQRFFEWRNLANADDLTQTVLLRGMEKIQEGTTVYSGDPGGFFWGIARNVLKEATRPGNSVLAAVEVADPSAYRPGPVLNPLESKIYLKECLGRLEKAERDLLIQYVLGTGLPSGMSTQAARLRVHRIRRKLAELRKKSEGS